MFIFFLELWFPKEFTLKDVSWSLCIEWFLYLIFPFLLIKSRKWFDKPLILCCIAAVVFVLAPVLNTQKMYDKDVNYLIGELRMSNGKEAFPRCIASYAVGLAVYKNNTLFIEKLNQYWYAVALLILVVYGISLSDIVVTILYGLFTLVVTQANRISTFFASRAMCFLGLISYSIYLNHMIFLRVLNFSFKKGMWSGTGMNIFIGLVLFLTMAIASSCITYQFIELPYSNWLNKITKK